MTITSSENGTYGDTVTNFSVFVRFFGRRERDPCVTPRRKAKSLSHVRISLSDLYSTTLSGDLCCLDGSHDSHAHWICECACTRTGTTDSSLSAPTMNARPLLPGLLLLREARLATLFMLSRGVRAPSRSWPPAQTSEGIVARACGNQSLCAARPCGLHSSGQCRRR